MGNRGSILLGTLGDSVEYALQAEGKGTGGGGGAYREFSQSLAEGCSGGEGAVNPWHFCSAMLRDRVDCNGQREALGQG